MFKTVLVSTFLLFNFNFSCSIKPNHNNVGGQLTSIYGSYCFNEHFDDLDTLEHYGDVVLSNFYGENKPLVNFYDSAVLSYQSYSADTFTFNHANVNQWNIVFYLSGYGSLSISIYNGDYVDDLGNNQDLTVFFPTEVSLNDVSLQIFNSFFNGNGNSLVTSYTGWYSIINPSYDIDSYLDVEGFFIVDNNLYNHLHFAYENAYTQLYSKGTFSSPLHIIFNGQLQTKNFIYFDNVMLNGTARAKLSSKGTFNYFYEPVQYTFGEMIFSVMDAPIYMLSQLFSFELLGIQFYVAFMGVVTIVLICFVLKKII